MANMPQLNAQDLVTLVEKAGWVEKSCGNGSSHRQFHRSGDLNVVTIADHGSKPVPFGTTKNILQTAGLGDVLKQLQKGTPYKAVVKQLQLNYG
jgi:predicted RNA binding protein YcfA (HicA-like mRNA interferase family)